MSGAAILGERMLKERFKDGKNGRGLGLYARRQYEKGACRPKGVLSGIEGRLQKRSSLFDCRYENGGEMT